ncbi:MAG: tRNA epoxyqueuosine(34) reductase QueG [Thermomicrobiales bacterium]|nr:tRNA epoxyqueuosine(34) reductase QueG [Thermomicrobiales bacterium]
MTAHSHGKTRFASAPWSQPAPLSFEPEVSLDDIRTLAAEAGFVVAAVTTADPYPGLRAMLEGHIDAGHLTGLDWFDHARAEVAADPRALHDNARSIVSLGIPYFSGPAEKPDDVPRGRISRYAWGIDYHRVFRKRLQLFLSLLEVLVGRPVESRLLSDTARTVDRAAAVRSGLGWYGKHSCVIVPGHGSWVMLGEAFVDVAIEKSAPLDRDCGSCSRCLDRCPTGAIVAPYIVDAPRCLSFQTIEQRGAIPREIRPLLGDWVFGCDVCQEVCPYTGAAAIVDDPDFSPRSEENRFPRLEWLLRMSEEEFRAVYAGTAVLRTKRRGLARNAAVAMGNAGDRAVVPILVEALRAHDEPLVRGHAAWALGRLDGQTSRSALDRALRAESDADVQEEIRAALLTT